MIRLEYFNQLELIMEEDQFYKTYYKLYKDLRVRIERIIRIMLVNSEKGVSISFSLDSDTSLYQISEIVDHQDEIILFIKHLGLIIPYQLDHLYLRELLLYCKESNKNGDFNEIILEIDDYRNQFKEDCPIELQGDYSEEIYLKKIAQILNDEKV